jgi:starch synthase
MLKVSSSFFFFLYCRDKLVIAPYGFDNSTWDPSKDNFLPENYRAEDMKGKAVCKVALQQHLALSDSASTILVSFCSWGHYVTLLVCLS